MAESPRNVSYEPRTDTEQAGLTTLREYVASNPLQVREFADVATRVPAVTDALITVLGLPKPTEKEVDLEVPTLGIPLLDGTYDMAEITEGEIPLKIIAFTPFAHSLLLTVGNPDGEDVKIEYGISMPFGTGGSIDPSCLNLREDMVAIDRRVPDNILYAPLYTQEPASYQTYTSLLQEGIEAVLTTLDNADSMGIDIKENIEWQTRPITEDEAVELFDELYSEVWTGLQIFSQQDISTIANASELAKITAPIASDILMILGMCGGSIEEHAEKPTMFEIKKDASVETDAPTNPNGSMKRIVYYRLSDRLVLIGMDVDEESNTDADYMLYIPFSEDPSGMHVDDFRIHTEGEEGRYKPGETPLDQEVSQSFANVLQRAVRDVLRFAPSPSGTISI